METKSSARLRPLSVSLEAHPDSRRQGLEEGKRAESGASPTTGGNNLPSSIKNLCHYTRYISGLLKPDVSLLGSKDVGVRC